MPCQRRTNNQQRVRDRQEPNDNSAIRDYFDLYPHLQVQPTYSLAFGQFLNNTVNGNGGFCCQCNGIVSVALYKRQRN